MKKTRCRSAFTLVEAMVATAVSCFVGLIIYGIASEGLTDFARNFSINRSYGDGRRTLDRLGIAMQSAGHVPILVDATGATTAVSPAAGVRFWRYSSTPCYLITTPALTSSTIAISLISPGTANTIMSPPVAGDMITIAGLGFQAPVQTVTLVPTSSATLTFASSVASNTSPALSTLPSGTLSCLDWIPVAFITVGTQLRYYPRFIAGTTNISTPANYKVISNLIATAPALPFSLGPAPSINVDLYAEAPDYNNRKLDTSNTYTYFQTALAPRNPTLLRSPY